MFYYRQLNWQEAARNYRRLYELFPQNDHLREDGWRLAWCDYLLRDPKTAEVINAYLMMFPDSPRAPAALYWLGMVQEQQGALAEARALYALLVKRFVHSYYAPQAAVRLAAIRTRLGSLAVPTDSAAAPLAAALIPVLAPPVVPPGLACVAAAPSAAAQPALILQALDLRNLEEEFLKAALAVDNPPAELRLLLAETSAAQTDATGALFGALRAVPAYARIEFPDLPEEVWDFLYPQAYWKLIEAQARLNHLDPYLVMGLVRQESAFNARALSVANARGLMQILPETAAQSTRPSRTRNAARRLYDPTYNVRVGCAYLAVLMKDFDGRPELALAAYNAGDFRVKDWVKKSSLRDPAMFLETIPIPATRTYVELVLRDTEIYRQLLSGSPHFAQCR
jgi:soluble lytic murein transglycosylase